MSATLPQLIRRTQSLRTAYEEVVSFCVPYLASAWHGTSDESWLAREVLIKAYLDQGQVDEAYLVVKELENHFGFNSQRVALLKGLVYEAQLDFSRALALYMDLLHKNRNNVLAAKRVVALKRSQGEDCTQSLNLLLQDNQSDLEVWFELMELEMTRGKFEEAVYCCDEVLLGNPHSHHVLCLYAELLLSCQPRNKQRVVEARQYFSQALVVNGGRSARSAWGLLVACNEEEAEAGDDQELARSLNDKAKTLLLQIYRDSPLMDLVKPCLDKF